MLSCFSRYGAGLLVVEAPAGLTSLGPRANRSKGKHLEGDSVSPCPRDQASFTECLICNTQALPGHASKRALLDGSLNLALSNAFVKSLIKTGLVMLQPGGSANIEDLLAFPWVSEGVGTLWEKVPEKLKGGRLSFPFLLLSRTIWSRAFVQGFQELSSLEKWSLLAGTCKPVVSQLV